MLRNTQRSNVTECPRLTVRRYVSSKEANPKSRYAFMFNTSLSDLSQSAMHRAKVS